MKSLILVFVFTLFLSCQKDNINDVILEEQLTDIDGNQYKTVKIGNQIWMAENLRTKRFRNGDVIQFSKNAEEWKTTLVDYCYYNDSKTLADKYGFLYSERAITDLRLLAPEGWHIPTVDEWNTLFNYLEKTYGKERVAKSISSKEVWNSFSLENTIGNNRDENNDSGLNIIPLGYRTGTSESYRSMGYGDFATIATKEARFMVYLHVTTSGIPKFFEDFENWGITVRCIKDSN